MNIKIRKVEAKDWKQINELFNECRTKELYSTPKTELSDKEAKEYVKRLAKSGINLVAETDNKIVGLIELILIDTKNQEHTCYGNQLNVLKEYRRKGIAKQLFAKAINVAKKKKITMIFFYVVETNKNAIKLYKKLKFKKVGQIPRFYKFGNKYVDNCIFCKLL